MSDLLLPGRVARELQRERWQEERRRSRALIEELFEFNDRVCREWSKHLRKLDPYLRLGRARPNAHTDRFAVRPGFYHWIRDNPTTEPTVAAITTADDGWCEPDSGLLRDLGRADLQNPRAVAWALERRERRERAVQAERDREKTARLEELAERWQAATRAQVSMNRDTPWSQNAAGKRGAKR